MSYAFIIFRPAWVIVEGVKYQPHDYVVTGWQDDDLPIFSSIQSIFVACDTVVFKTKRATSLGIDRHYHSLLIQETSTEHPVCLSELKVNCVYHSHLLNNGGLYITIRSHIENIC